MELPIIIFILGAFIIYIGFSNWKKQRNLDRGGNRRRRPE